MITFKNENLSNLAIIVENDLIQASIARNLPKFSNINVFYSKQIKDLAQKAQSVEIKLDDGSLITTKLLIGNC